MLPLLGKARTRRKPSASRDRGPNQYDGITGGACKKAKNILGLNFGKDDVTSEEHLSCCLEYCNVQIEPFPEAPMYSTVDSLASYLVDLLKNLGDNLNIHLEVF